MAKPGKKTLLVLDGQGGGVGRKMVERLLSEKLDFEYIVVGTNAAATSNMMKGGVSAGATGENAWIYNCAKADIITGPIGIVLANAMRGEISPKMAAAAADSPAERILIPVSNCHVHIAGLPESGLPQQLDDALDLIRQCARER